MDPAFVINKMAGKWWTSPETPEGWGTHKYSWAILSIDVSNNTAVGNLVAKDGREMLRWRPCFFETF
jgi:hypothetical protein